MRSTREGAAEAATSMLAKRKRVRFIGLDTTPRIPRKRPVRSLGSENEFYFSSTFERRSKKSPVAWYAAGQLRLRRKP